jgi:hypothetical protein
MRSCTSTVSAVRAVLRTGHLAGTLHPMPGDEDRSKRTLEVAATAGNAIEADLIRQRLAEAGIQAVVQRSIGGPEWGTSGGQYVYVEAEHLARAQAALASAEGISDEELAKMAEEAGGPD